MDMKMNRKMSKNYYVNADCQCTLHRRKEPNTFSKFVDKVVGDFPVTVSSKYASIDPNNPIEVLKNKGLLNISRSNMRTGDCSSDVKLNFFSEESKYGETLKIFSSCHHFKHGNLVYSSTHELLPNLHREFGRSNEWRQMRGRRALSAAELRNKFETKPRRKKLTDFFDDVERQKIIRRFEKEARKRHLYSRSVSPVNVCENVNENRDRYLKILRSERLQNQIAPFTISRSKKESPEGFRHYAVCTSGPAIWHPETSTYVESSSELSNSSGESLICSSPMQIFKKTSRYKEQYKRSTTSPISKFNEDLLVKPAHTCRKVSRIGKHRNLKTSLGDGGLPLKSILSHKRGKSSSKYSPRRITFSDNITDQHRKARHHKESIKGDLYYGEKPVGNSNGYKPNGKFNHEITNMPARELFDQRERERKELTTTESETDSDISSRTLPFPRPRDSANKRGIFEQHYSSSDSQTSICSVRYNHQGKAAIYSTPDSFKRSSHQSRCDTKCYHTERKADTYEHNGKENAKSLNGKHGNPRHFLSKKSLDNYLRQTMLEEHQRNRMEIMRNIVNKEALEDYREKYRDNSNKRKTLRSVTDRDYEKCELLFNNTAEECEACVMERLRGEKI